MRRIPHHISSILYVSILLFTSFFLVWGNLFITISAILFIVLWLYEGAYKEKFIRLLTSPPALAFLSLFLVILLWSLNQISEPNSYHEIWKNLPLFIFAFVIGSNPKLSSKQLYAILLVFVISVTANTLFNFAFFLWKYDEYTDVRNASFFMSYIRLSLYILMSIIIAVYYLFYSTAHTSVKARFFLWATLLWNLFFLLFLESITGYVAIICLSFVFAFSQSIRHTHIHSKIISLILLFCILFFSVFIIAGELRYFIKPDVVNVENLDSVTRYNNKYRPFEKKGMLENGHWVNLYICDDELNTYWSEFSSIPLSGLDAKNQKLKKTVIRYMTSKNLRKDYEGLTLLTPYDIENIENGITNYRFSSEFILFQRIYEVIWEFHYYLQGNNPAGHSVTQRFEFISCAWEVFKKNAVWGTGPVHFIHELHSQYPLQKHQLPEHLWLKPHNQFLTFLVKYGIVGFSIISLCFLIFYMYSHKFFNVLSISWFVITCISFFNEDTLENINGLVFFSFFGCLFLCAQQQSVKKVM